MYSNHRLRSIKKNIFLVFFLSENFFHNEFIKIIHKSNMSEFILSDSFISEKN